MSLNQVLRELGTLLVNQQDLEVVLLRVEGLLEATCRVLGAVQVSSLTLEAVEIMGLVALGIGQYMLWRRPAAPVPGRRGVRGRGRDRPPGVDGGGLLAHLRRAVSPAPVGGSRSGVETATNGEGDEDDAVYNVPTGGGGGGVAGSSVASAGVGGGGSLSVLRPSNWTQ
jgi:hypothetical protein